MKYIIFHCCLHFIVTQNCYVAIYKSICTRVCLCVMVSSIAELRCCEKYYIEDQSRRKEKSGQPTVDFSYKTKL